MSKVYILTESDFDNLLARIDRNPKHGHGGSSQCLSKEKQKAHDEAHAYFNYEIRAWVSGVQK